AAFVVAPGDGDGFLAKVLPPEGLRTEFDLGIGWSSARGLYFRGAASLDATLPVQASLGPIAIDSVFLAIHPGATGLPMEAGLSATGPLGPVSAAISRAGIRADLSFPAGGGNLGVAEVTPVFRPPNGIALKIDAGAVVGGGFLDFDPAAGRYAGGVQL